MVRATEVFFQGGPWHDEVRILEIENFDLKYIYVVTVNMPIIYTEDDSSPVEVTKHRYYINKTMCDGLYGHRAIAIAEDFDAQYLIDLAFDALLQKVSSK